MRRSPRGRRGHRVRLPGARSAAAEAGRAFVDARGRFGGAASDGAAGVLAARMAARAAVYNVRINLGSIKDEVFTTELRREADRLEAEAEAREKEILSLVKL